MSDLTATPQSSPVPAGTQSPQRVEGANHARDDTQPEEKPHREPEHRARPEHKPPKSYEPAVTVAPSLAHLKAGSTVSGKIERIDGTGRPILDTREGVFALRPDAGLKPGDVVTIVLDRVDRQITGEVTTRAGQPVQPPIEVNLILIGLKHLPAGPPAETVPPAPSPQAPFHYIAPPGAAGRITDFEVSSLSIARGAPPTRVDPATGKIVAAGTGVSEPQNLPETAVGSVLAAQESDAPSEPAAGKVDILESLEGRVISAHVARVEAAAADPGLFKPGEGVLLRLSEPGSGRTVGDFAIKTEGTIVTAAQAAGVKDAPPHDSAEPPAPGPSDDPDHRHYLETPLATFVFRADASLPPGTRLAVSVAPAGAGTRHSQVAVHSPPADAGDVRSTSAPPDPVGSPPPPAAQTGEVHPVDEAAAKALAAETGAVASAQGAKAPLPELPEAWPVLSQTYAALMQSAPDAAAAMAARIPGPQTAFSNGLLFVLATVASNLPRALIGENAARELERNDRADLIRRLAGEVSRLLRATGGERTAGEWRYLPIPHQSDGGLQNLYLFWKTDEHGDRGAPQSGTGDDPQMRSNRFIVDMSFARLGRIQLDGFYRPQRLDMHVRSADPLPTDMRRDIGQLFLAALEAGNLAGNLDFSDLRPPPVDLAGLIESDERGAPHPDLFA